VRTHFTSSRIDATEYQSQITDDLSPDPGDRAHVAACFGGRADVLLTRNTKHYQSPLLGEHNVRVMTADDYLCELLRRHPGAVTDSFVSTANSRRRPPVTPNDLAFRIAGTGAPKFADQMRRRLTSS
jgi:hypothetical protein